MSWHIAYTGVTRRDRVQQVTGVRSLDISSFLMLPSGSNVFIACRLVFGLSSVSDYCFIFMGLSVQDLACSISFCFFKLSSFLRPRCYVASRHWCRCIAPAYEWLQRFVFLGGNLTPATALAPSLTRRGFSFSVSGICSVYIYIDTLFPFLLLTYTAVCGLCLFRMLSYYTRIWCATALQCTFTVVVDEPALDY